MSASTILNQVQMTVASAPGTSDIPLGSAVSPFQTYAAAGATNGMLVSYCAIDGTAMETGQATYSTTGPKLTGRVVDYSTASNALLNLSAATIVSCVIRAADVVGGGMSQAKVWFVSHM